MDYFWARNKGTPCTKNWDQIVSPGGSKTWHMKGSPTLEKQSGAPQKNVAQAAQNFHVPLNKSNVNAGTAVPAELKSPKAMLPPAPPKSAPREIAPPAPAAPSPAPAPPASGVPVPTGHAPVANAAVAPAPAAPAPAALAPAAPTPAMPNTQIESTADAFSMLRVTEQPQQPQIAEPVDPVLTEDQRKMRLNQIRMTMFESCKSGMLQGQTNICNNANNGHGSNAAMTHDAHLSTDVYLQELSVDFKFVVGSLSD
jgi:hypothetical protein